MRHRPTVCCLVVCLLFAQSLPAQTGDWSAVISIPVGTQVRVRIQRGPIECTLVSVTDAELVCERERRRFEDTAKYVVARQDVRQVRRVSGSATKLVGIGVGAVVGAGIGVAIGNKDTQTRAEGAVVGALGGILIGSIMGSIIRDRGRIVYER